MSTWTNWSRLETARPSREVVPASVDEVVDEVRRARESGSTVKMVGTGHSFTAIAAPEATLLRPQGLTGVLAVDREAMTVTARAGTQLKVLNAELENLGLSLHNMGDIAEQTLAGAVSTGTHGTGGRAAGLAAQLVGLELVTGTGELLRATATENADVLEVARVGLGALGILTTLTFRVEPLFVVEAVEEPFDWADALAAYDEITASADHVDMYWFPHTDRVQIKQNFRRGTDLSQRKPLSRAQLALDDRFLQNTVFGAATALLNRAPGRDPAVQPARRAAAQRPHLLRPRPQGLRRRARRGLPRDGVRRAARGRPRRAPRVPARARRQRPADQLPGRAPDRARRRRTALHRQRPRLVLPRLPHPPRRRAPRLLRPHGADPARPRRPAALGQGAHPDAPPTSRRRTRGSGSSSPCATGWTRSGCSPTPTCAGCSATEPQTPAWRAVAVPPGDPPLT